MLNKVKTGKKYRISTTGKHWLKEVYTYVYSTEQGHGYVTEDYMTFVPKHLVKNRKVVVD